MHVEADAIGKYVRRFAAAHLRGMKGQMSFDTIEQAIEDLRNGKIIIVADDEDRENEGDLVCAAELVTPEIDQLHGPARPRLICLALTAERCDELGLPQKVERNTEEQSTAFTVIIDADRALRRHHRHLAPATARAPSTWPSIPRPSRPTCAGPATCRRCARGRAACCSASGIPRPPWTSPASPDSIPPASSARS